MNKLVKGSIAGAAGVALLLGGAGTFALWNADATVAGGVIQAGELTISPASSATWTDSGNTDVDLDTYIIVPGDVLTFEQELTIVVTGTNLTAKLALGSNAIEAAVPADAADVALASYLSESATPSITWDPIETGITAGVDGAGDPDGTYDFEPGTYTVTVTSEITFNENGFDASGDGFENSAMNGSVDLSGFDVTLTQIAA